MIQIFQLPRRDLFDTTMISPDGRFLLVYGPDRPADLYRAPQEQQKDNPLIQLTLPKQLFVTAATFSRGDYNQDFRTRRCVFIADSSELLLLDLKDIRIISIYPVRNAMTVAYGVGNSFFVGTTDGAILMLVEQGEELFMVGRPLKISDSAIVHFAPSPLQADYVAVYTDNGKLYSVQFGSRQFSAVDTDNELNDLFGAMQFHPYLPMFTLWRNSGEVSISTPPSQMLNIKLPEVYCSRQLLLVQTIAKNLLLVVTTMTVTEIQFSIQSSGDAEIVRQRTIYTVGDAEQIVAAAQLSRAPSADAIVVTARSDTWLLA